MRTWFWTLLVFIGAVALALVLRDHDGNVLILVEPWRIEVSLTFAVLLLIAAFVVLHVLLRLITWVSHSPDRYRSWRSVRAQRRDHNLMASGWIHLLEGRYEQADKDLTKLLGKTQSETSKVVAGLASARAAHHLGDRRRRDEALAKAKASARDDVALKDAVAVVTAEAALDDGRPEEAVALLQPLQDASTRYFHATRLLVRAHQRLGNFDRVYELTRLLVRRGAMDADEARQYIEKAGAARLAAAGEVGFKSVWSDFKSDEKALPELARVAAQILSATGRHDEAARILENAIGANLDDRLLAQYAQCPPEQVKRRMNKVEGWLKHNPGDASLLATMGMLCMAGELWGQAERYLLQSMQLRSDARIHALLGNLYEALGRRDDALQHWRLGAEVSGELPVLTAGRALPSAETQHDPSAIDTGEQTEQPASIIPDAASAADVISDDLRTPSAAVVEPTSGSRRSMSQAPEDPAHEYFDSAPIPGVDVTQTSDTVPRTKAKP